MNEKSNRLGQVKVNFIIVVHFIEIFILLSRDIFIDSSSRLCRQNRFCAIYHCIYNNMLFFNL